MRVEFRSYSSSKHNRFLLRRFEPTITTHVVVAAWILIVSSLFVLDNHHPHHHHGVTAAASFYRRHYQRTTKTTRVAFASTPQPQQQQQKIQQPQQPQQQPQQQQQKEQQQQPELPVIFRKQLVLIGGGHAHLQVIKALNHKSRPRDMDVTLIDGQSSAVYSGMVPGCVSKFYTPQETMIALKPLTDWAKIRFVQNDVVDIDLERKCILLRQNHHNADAASEPIPFDCVSLDIGSTTLGLDQIPGVREYAISTRPISKLIQRIEEAEKVELLRQQHQEEENCNNNNNNNNNGDEETRNRRGDNNNNNNNNNNDDDEDNNNDVKVVVVGGGPAGIELATSFVGRWKNLFADRQHQAQPRNVSVTLLDSVPELLPNESPACRAAVRKWLADRDIQVMYNCHVQEITQDRIYYFDDEVKNDDDRKVQSLRYSHCIWATGAASHRLANDTLRKRGLSVNDRGWIQVSTTLQSLSHPYVFAAGDCSSIELPKGQPPPPKAGVYAVRAGPILIENLIRYFNDDDNNNTPLKQYQPQEDFLKLLVGGDGTALGFRFGIPFYGKWVFQLKDRIDRNFMALFQPENLPNLGDGAPIDTSQYDDDVRRKRRPPLPVSDAAALLQRTDDDVDYEEAWDVLRDMSEKDEYQRQVVACIIQEVQEARSFLSRSSTTIK